MLNKYVKKSYRRIEIAYYMIINILSCLLWLSFALICVCSWFLLFHLWLSVPHISVCTSFFTMQVTCLAQHNLDNSNIIRLTWFSCVNHEVPYAKFLKIEATWPLEILVSYLINNTQCHNLEDHNGNDMKVEAA